MLLCPLFGARHGDQKDRGLTVRRGPWGLAELAEIVYQTNCEGVSSKKKNCEGVFCWLRRQTREADSLSCCVVKYVMEKTKAKVQVQGGFS